DDYSKADTHVPCCEVLSHTYRHRLVFFFFKQKTAYEIEVDSRPSDAIALAIRADAPIFAADEVIEESGIEFEGEEVTEEEIESKVSEFKQFLEQVTPDEFAVDPEDD